MKMRMSDLAKKARSPLTACYSLLFLAVVVNVFLWTATNKLQPKWPNVPPSPSTGSASTLGLGDHQLAYRLFAYQLQVMGNEGGQFTPLYMYDYNRLGKWFNVLHQLDPVSDYVPFLAAYYFGATQKPQQQLKPVIEYLATAGRVDRVGKWQWLSHAVYLAYHRYKDTPWALELAHELAAESSPEMPYWTKQMPAVISASSGDKETALKLTRSILLARVKEEGEKVDPVEVNFMLDFICNRLQSKDEAKLDPLCQKK